MKLKLQRIFNINKVNEEFLDHAVFICNKTKGKI